MLNRRKLPDGKLNLVAWSRKFEHLTREAYLVGDLSHIVAIMEHFTWQDRGSNRGWGFGNIVLLWQYYSEIWSILHQKTGWVIGGQVRRILDCYDNIFGKYGFFYRTKAGWVIEGEVCGILDCYDNISVKYGAFYMTGNRGKCLGNIRLFGQDKLYEIHTIHIWSPCYMKSKL